MTSTSRREFIKKSSAALGLIPVIDFPLLSLSPDEIDEPLSVNIFSKHLQFLDYRKTGEMAAEMGFSGVDLTVRPDGHVEPGSVSTDLPNAVLEIAKGGSRCDMITTNIESVKNPSDVDIIKTASRSGVKYYRTNWFKYSLEFSMPEVLEVYKNQILELSQLNKELGIIGCYQNHAGRDVGSSFWEVYHVLEKADPQYFGAQYDIRHATVEGGLSWQNGLRLLLPSIKVIVLKDFKWEQREGKWSAVNTPVGEGMVDFDTYFKILKKNNIKPPVSLHLEYPLGGAEKGNRSITVDQKIVFDAMKRDLKEIQRLWKLA